MEQRTQKDLNVFELKAMVYDQNVAINKATQIIKILEQELSTRPVEEVKEVTPVEEEKPTE